MQEGAVKDKLKFYLGKINKHTRYEGELVGIILVIKLIRRAGVRNIIALEWTIR